ncbi:MAG: hypothetical protein ACRYHQ_04465, partial [Janthinobacterium lividum]
TGTVGERHQAIHGRRRRYGPTCSFAACIPGEPPLTLPHGLQALNLHRVCAGVRLATLMFLHEMSPFRLELAESLS